MYIRFRELIASVTESFYPTAIHFLQPLTPSSQDSVSRSTMLLDSTYVSFYVWLISLSIIPSRFISVSPNGRISSFLCLNNIHYIIFMVNIMNIYNYIIIIIRCLFLYLFIYINNYIIIINIFIYFIIIYNIQRLLISWLQPPSAVILEPRKIKSDTVSTVSPSISHEVVGPDAMIFIFWMLSFKRTYHILT